MTNRFSPEYIAYILSDEASVLQRYWDWKEGDWFVATSPYTEVQGDDWPEIDIAVGEINLIHNAWRMEGGDYKTAGAWLPTLTDLLGMIEEAGWAWGGYKRDLSGYAWYCQDDWDGQYDVDPEEDKLLAAAKLAVKVLEEKE